MTIEELLCWAKSQCCFNQRASNSDNLDAESDPRILLCHVLGINSASLIAKANQPVNDQQIEQFKLLMEDRLKGQPIAYLIQSREFWSLNLKVDEHVFNSSA